MGPNRCITWHLPCPGLWQGAQEQCPQGGGGGGRLSWGSCAEVLRLQTCRTSPTLRIAVLRVVLLNFQTRNPKGSLELCCLIWQPPVTCSCLYLSEFKFGLQFSSLVSLATL